MLKLIAMDSRQKLILFMGLLSVGAATALYETSRASRRPIALNDSASLVSAPALPEATQAPRANVSATEHRLPTVATPAPAAPLKAPTQNDLVPATAPAPAPRDTTDANGDLRDSQERLSAIDNLELKADRLFDLPELPDGFGQWSVNPQNMDQLDYQTPEGSITAWYSPDGVARAQEAQLANGQLVDRWYNTDGQVEQIMHQIDPQNSYSVYYYASGEVEATRIVRGGTEIFTRYSRDGRQLERTQTSTQ